MQVLVIGGMAAGTKAAAKIRREGGKDCHVTLIEKGNVITSIGCGLPYYIGGVFDDYNSLFINSNEEFAQSTEVTLRCGVEAVGLDRANKRLRVKELETGKEESLSYDKLVIATGASPIRPQIEGIDLPGVYTLRTPEDGAVIRNAVAKGIKRAVILGGGAVGLEMAENLKRQGVRPVIIDRAPQILPGFDRDFAEYVENRLAEKGIPCFTGENLISIEGNGRVEIIRTESRKIKADALILAAGVRPNTDFLKDSGLIFSKNGALVVDERMCTNDADIFAAGDCVVLKNRITGRETWEPLGSVAAVTGRICALAVLGEKVSYPGVLGTALIKTEDVNVGKTGLTLAETEDMDIVEATITTEDKVRFYPGVDVFVIRLVADRSSHRLLGVQVAGRGAVDNILDIGVTAICNQATLESLQSMDLGYAPSFSTAVHPLIQAVNLLLNKLQGKFVGIDGEGFHKLPEDTLCLDVMKTATLRQYRSMPVKTIHGPIPGVDFKQPIVLLCEKGKQGYLAQRKLREYGYENTVVLEGGVEFYNIEE